MNRKSFISLLYIGFTSGFILGVVLTSIITTLVISDGSIHLYTTAFSKVFRNPLTAFLIHSLICGILGMIMLGLSGLYEIEKWDLLKATIVHFLLSIISFYATAFFLRWFSPSNTKAVCTSMLMFIVNYTGIWLSQYLSCKTQVEEINKRLDLKKCRNQDCYTV